MIAPAAIAMGIFFVFFLLRLVLRNTWGAAAALVALLTGSSVAGAVNPLAAAVFFVAFNSLVFWMMIRFGILPLTLVILLQIVVGAFSN